MVRKKNRLITDLLREIRNTYNRFLSILVLSALAVAFLSGLRAAAPDMQDTADRYYDSTHLMDGYVLSTLGLTDEDLEALSAADGVAEVEGSWAVDAVAVDAIVSVRAMPDRLNLLRTEEGRLPETPDECVTEKLLLAELGLSVGDRIRLDPGPDEADSLVRRDYTIVGTVTSPLYVGTDRGSSSLGNGSVNAFVYVPAENFDCDYYTVAYFTGDGLQELDSYGDEYDRRLEALVDSMDGLAEERSALRYESVVTDASRELEDARAELADAEKELEDARNEAMEELEDARTELLQARTGLDAGRFRYYDGVDTYNREIADAEQELEDARNELEDAEKELADGRREYEDGLAQYEEGVAELADARRQYEEGAAEYEDGKSKYDEATDQYEQARLQYGNGAAELDYGREIYKENKEAYLAGVEQLDSAAAQLAASRQEYEQNLALLDAGQEALTAQRGELDAKRQEYEAGLALLGSMSESDPAYAPLKAQLDSAKTELDAGEAAISKAQQDLDQGYAQAAAANEQMNAAQQQLDAEYAKLPEAEKQLDDAAAQIRDSDRKLEEGAAELESAAAELAENEAVLADAKQELDDAAAQIADGQARSDQAKADLEQARQELLDGQKQIDDGWEEYRDGEKELEEARIDGQKELEDAWKELEDGEAEYRDGLKEFSSGIAEAQQELSDAETKLEDARVTLEDAQEELDGITGCEWYVLGRNTNTGFVGYGQDSDRVGNLANVFPVIFFLVAALACLTTMTRMVEEQRTQIGALKAMGFSRLAISAKYIGYALAASLAGGILGLALGRTLIPQVIANAFNIMYHIPALHFKHQPLMYAGAVLAAAACTTGAALWASLSTLVAAPAELMRPRAPKPGKRVFLEYVKPVWRRLSFIWKVTMRNLFRYKRRFWMTVVGIAGCTALIVTGFGLHESIFYILDRQFDGISHYDAGAGLNEDATEEELEQVEEYLDRSPYVERHLIVNRSMAEASSDGAPSDVYLFTVDDPARFSEFIALRHRLDEDPVLFPEDGILISEKLSELLGVEKGSVITLTLDEERAEARVADVVENYVQHYIYLGPAYYEKLFGEAPEDNMILITYVDGTDQEKSDEVSADLMQMEGVSSYSYIASIRDSFTDSMVAIDYAVIIIIIAAAALAFVVLYNLTNINITERTRELATLKVLGFYDTETTAYVYRENIFLTAFGILLGLVAGRFLHAWLIRTVEVNIVMFGRTAPAYAYVFAALMTVVFSVTVNIAAHFKLKKVDMVESLKTVE